MKNRLALFVAAAFLAGCNHFAPGQLKKHDAPGQHKKHEPPGQAKKG